MSKEKTINKDRTYSSAVDNKRIILFNDDVNTFDFVISSLIELCGHELEQAEQCAVIVHNNGKCDIKEGSYNELFPIHVELVTRGLSAEIA